MTMGKLAPDLTDTQEVQVIHSPARIRAELEIQRARLTKAKTDGAKARETARAAATEEAEALEALDQWLDKANAQGTWL